MTINIVNKDTRAVKVANGACSITDAANGRVRYTPISADVNTSSSYDVEFKAVAGDGTTYHLPNHDYEPLVIQDQLG